MTKLLSKSTSRSRESTRARWLFATSLLAIAVMLITVFLTSQEPDMRSPHDTFWAVMRALKNHDQVALQRLTTSQGYTIITAHMKDNSAASYAKLHQSIQKILSERDLPLPKDNAFYGKRYIMSLSNTHMPDDLKIRFWRGIKGWELDNIRGYELEPLIRKEKGTSVIPTDPDVVLRPYLYRTQTS